MGPVDPVTGRNHPHGLLAVTENNVTNLTRTATISLSTQALDFTVGLFTPNGETVSSIVVSACRCLSVAGPETVKAKIKHYGMVPRGHQARRHPGHERRHTTGSHLNHFTSTMPVFHKGEIVAFTCCMAHWLDVGGTLGQVHDRYLFRGNEIPIVKYRREGDEPGAR